MTESRARASRAAIVTVFVLAWMGAAALGGIASAGNEAPVEAEDPVVREVLRLLGEGLGSDVVAAWLARSEANPARLSADDLVALKRAGADDALIKMLVTRSAGVPPGPSDTETTTLTLLVDYRAYERAETEEYLEGPELFVYVDGRLADRVPSRVDIGGRGPTEVTLPISPGIHRLRIARERHELRGRGDRARWVHEARVSPDTITLPLDRPGAWRIELRWRDSSFSSRTTMTWTLEREGTVVAEETIDAVPKDDWPRLCDDLPEGERAEPSCVPWPDLWTGATDLPSREEVLSTIRTAAGRGRR